MIEAKVVEDSVSGAGKRISTLQLIYPRMIHSEFMTHRVFSRNASSSRAIPVKKMIEMVRNEPAMPVHWGKNQSGMQAGEQLSGKELDLAKAMWLVAARNAADMAEEMNLLGLHKQVANRILEPFQHIHVVVTATEWENFFSLRDHEAAAPEIQAVATSMKMALNSSIPKLLKTDEWHLPYVGAGERVGMSEGLACKVSAARCARVSYLKHDGSTPSIDDDLVLYERLVGSMPIHASPVEHQATPDSYDHLHGWRNYKYHGNFVGWIQNRKLVESDFNSKL